MTHQQEIHHLIAKYLEGSLTNQERDRFFYLLDSPDAQEIISTELKEVFQFQLQDDYNFPETDLRIKQAVNDQININRPTDTPVVHRIHFLKTAWLRYAAAVLIILSAAVYIYISQQQGKAPLIITEHAYQPGQDKAILTLSDGRQITLDKNTSENITDANVVIQQQDGILNYSAATTANRSDITYNTMSTPRGGQYQLILPDGSKVWLNAASGIKYPTVFQGKNRTVELSGEAYFDIKKSTAPFIVKINRAEIIVLGTSFNVNAYEDEPAFSATLINGSIKVSSLNTSKIIAPGQQAEMSYTNADVLTIKNDIDINQVIAWQKGIFEFNGVSIDIIARQLSRWYDIDVSTDNNGKKIQLSGGITRKTPLKTVLKILEANGIFNKWENNKLTLYVKNK